MRFGQKTAKQTIEQVANNDKSLESLDLTKNASFCMKSVENCIALANALKANTVIKSLVLKECEVVDEGIAALAEALTENHTIEELDVSANKITTRGAIALAEGMAKNRGVKTLNMINQSQKVMGEEALERFIAVFESNLTLTKLMWKVDSRRTWELSKLFTRNVEIKRRLAGGAAIEDLLPAKLRGQGISSLVSAVPTAAKQAAVPTSGYSAPAAPAAPEAVAPEVPQAVPASEQETHPAEPAVTSSEEPVQHEAAETAA
mmetsp:Transcript_16638/g.29123  ORF Transcript_16638/g.29123 Transcript_16638/m.29123 type:complete len:261 (-) Transcript_16638:134-916(-)|eukprot:CAMPEP_0197652566 /NCGR_PEP_ID=MMETSP1338-20131121/34531_1 /TAXON_ID=43686 ORGANISM="Pelagodinium beii, Strain RCC1491" /NCGR_SAMPLE_ID=MMETSP1338 /ASSEMBLY_ACC=CAM_ASM_000754 /LENGTH=260 /DNA_ID=CAMNT_0043227473 /DNA_START=59 /DNA_END=841 /DNA_ORIENTATION=-